MAWVMVTLLGLLTLSGCAGTENVRILFRPSVDLHSDENGDPHAVWVRIYQLRNRSSFQGLDYADIVNEAEGIKKKDWYTTEVLKEEPDVVIYPPETSSDPPHEVEIEMESDKGAKFLGIVPLFRVEDENFWRQIVKVESRYWGLMDPVVKIFLERNTVKLDD